MTWVAGWGEKNPLFISNTNWFFLFVYLPFSFIYVHNFMLIYLPSYNCVLQYFRYFSWNFIYLFFPFLSLLTFYCMFICISFISSSFFISLSSSFFISLSFSLCLLHTHTHTHHKHTRTLSLSIFLSFNVWWVKCSLM